MRSTTTWLTIAPASLALLACGDPDPPAPTEAELEAQRIAHDYAAAHLRQEDPTPAADPAPATPMARLRGFAGFSADGRRFAYGSASASGGSNTCVLWVTEAGSPSADVLEMVFEDSEVDGAQRQLDEGGFTAERRAAPADLTLEAHLTDTPPTVTLRQGDRSVTHTIEVAPFPPTDTASIWGMSPDGTHVVIDVHGPQVNGMLTQAGSGTVQFFRVVAMP
ncbi:MAG: hypothetical protein AB7S26_06195 [Sandaracinaceae bacterium]